jgi:hypothetical protein
MSGSRLAPIAAIAIACAACLPTGPDEYSGPAYALTPGAGYADAGAALGVAADGSTPTLDAAVTVAPTPSPSPTPTPAPSDAGTPASGDASTPVPDAGGGGGLSSCKLDATTNSPGGNYANAYVCAIWIEDSAGKLVRTLAYYAGSRARYLTAYVASRSGAGVDATSGATINSGKSKAAGADTKVHSLSWDLKSAAGAAAASGSYKLKIELTSSNGSGPVTTIPFALGSSPVDLTPSGLGAGVSGVHFTCQ